MNRMIQEDLETTETNLDLYFMFCQKEAKSVFRNTDEVVFPRHIEKFLRTMFLLAYFGFYMFLLDS